MSPARVRRSADLDDADRMILELLTEDGRASNRWIAGRVGLTDATVAARIRRLRDAGVVGITAVFDWEVAGFAWEMFVFVEVEERLPRDVGDEIAALPEAHGVTLTCGSADLIVHALARDRAHLTELLTDRLVGINGIRHVRCDIVLETVQHRWGLATLPEVPDPALDFPDPELDLDDLDRALVASLARDGRRSNREVARQLGVSDGTVRSRIRRLEECGLMRIVAQIDPVALGVAGSIAHVGVEVAGAMAPAIGAIVREWPEVASCGITTGSHDLHLVVAVPDVVSLSTLVAERLRALPGVQRTTTWPAVDVLEHEYHLVRLFDDPS